MYDNLSDAAGQVVHQLSRRRFVAWLGKGGLALAGALGVDKLGEGAFAKSGTPCAQIRLPQIPVQKGQDMKFSFCTTKGNCAGLNRALEFLCATQIGCGQGLCDHSKFCDSVFVAANHVISECHPCPHAEQNCGDAELKCCCTVRVQGGFQMGTVSCGCDCVT